MDWPSSFIISLNLCVFNAFLVKLRFYYNRVLKYIKIFFNIRFFVNQVLWSTQIRFNGYYLKINVLCFLWFPQESPRGNEKNNCLKPCMIPVIYLFIFFVYVKYYSFGYK